MLLIVNSYFSKLNGRCEIIFLNFEPGFNLGKGFNITDFKIVHLDRKIIVLQTIVRVH